MAPKLRLLCLPARQATAWRWELAQLELGCGPGWPMPGSRGWAARARGIGGLFEARCGRVALAFDGYTLVGAIWTCSEHPVALAGPFVMPQFQATGLDSRLRAALLKDAAAASPDR